jgi:probable phosphoglycerate mutase
VSQSHRSSPLLYYVRHGETDWNAQGRVQGNRDVPLNALGHTQAIHAGDVLLGLIKHAGRRPRDFDYVSSPLSRASVSMELIRVQLGLPARGYRIDRRLRELSYGNWEGMTHPEMQAANPDLYAARVHDSWNVAPPAGEAFADVAVRLKEWYEGLTTDTVAVAHGGCMRALRKVLGLVDAAQAANFTVAQGVVYVFDGRSMEAFG